MSYIPPRTRDNNHYFVNTNSFDADDNLSWNEGPIAVLKHKFNNIKLFIDGSDNRSIASWRNSNIKYNKIQIFNNQLIALSTYTDNYANYFNANNGIRSRLEFTNSGRFITYKDQLSNARRTLTKWDGSERSDLPESYRGRFKNYAFSNRELNFEILKFSQWGSADIQVLEFTTKSAKYGQLNDMITVEVRCKDTNSEGIEGAPIFIDIGNQKDVEIFYTDGNCSITDANGLAEIQLILREHGKIHIKAKVGNPVEKATPNYEIHCIDDETEIYIRGASYQTQKFLNDPKGFYLNIISVLENIDGLIWDEIGFNQSNNVSSDDLLSEDMLIFLKRIKYNQQIYLSDTQSNNLRNEIILKLNDNFDIGFSDVEIRTSRRFVNL